MKVHKSEYKKQPRRVGKAEKVVLKKISANRVLYEALRCVDPYYDRSVTFRIPSDYLNVTNAVERALNRGADPDFVIDGICALLLAVLAGYTETAKVLLRYKAKVDDPQLAFEAARLSPHNLAREMMAELLPYGPDLSFLTEDDIAKLDLPRAAWRKAAMSQLKLAQHHLGQNLAAQTTGH